MTLVVHFLTFFPVIQEYLKKKMFYFLTVYVQVLKAPSRLLSHSALTWPQQWHHHSLSPSSGGGGLADLRAGLSRCHGDHFCQAFDVRATPRPRDLVFVRHRFKLSGTAGQRSLVLGTWPVGGADRVRPHSRYQTPTAALLNWWSLRTHIFFPYNVVPNLILGNPIFSTKIKTPAHLLVNYCFFV